MASLIDLSVNKRQGIKFDPKLTFYNSALLQVRKGQGNPKSRRYEHHVAEIDIDGREETGPDVLIFGPRNEPKYVNGLGFDNRVKMEWNAISRGLVPDPRLYASFKKSAQGKKLAMWLKLSYDEKAAWKYDVGAWADYYVRQHPGAFMRSFHNVLRGYMKEISDEMGMQEQSGKGKKEWRKIIDKGARALAYIISNKLFNDDITDNVYIAIIQQSFIYYEGAQLEIDFKKIPALNKALDQLDEKDELNKKLQEEGKLTEEQIKMLN
jgi:hypothetical protein